MQPRKKGYKLLLNYISRQTWFLAFVRLGISMFSLCSFQKFLLILKIIIILIFFLSCACNQGTFTCLKADLLRSIISCYLKLSPRSLSTGKLHGLTLLEAFLILWNLTVLCLNCTHGNHHSYPVWSILVSKENHPHENICLIDGIIFTLCLIWYLHTANAQ